MKSQMGVAVVRTTVQTTVLTAIAAVIFKVTGVDLKLEDLLPWVPIAAPVAAVFYRASRAIADRFPSIGYILFGIPRPPAYAPPPAPTP
jgi:spore germination protein YaaH